MKTLISITITTELREKLNKHKEHKGEPVSILVERVLNDYFKKEELNQLSSEEIRRRIQLLNIKKEAEDKIRELGGMPE